MTGDEPAAGGVAEAEALGPRHARRPHHGADDDVETAMCRCLRECAAQIARNLEVVALTDSPGGPHQLRVGLRRLRVALWLFRDEAGAEGAMLREEARAMARLVGPLRDRDVLADEILPRGLAGFADQPARAALAALLEADRAQARARIRAALAEPPMAGLARRLELFIADRGWRAECDGPRAAALARRLAGRVPGLLDRCLRRVRARGRDPARLSVEQRHELRKAVKTLRYAIEFLTPAGKGRAREYLRAVKALQGPVRRAQRCRDRRRAARAGARWRGWMRRARHGRRASCWGSCGNASGARSPASASTGTASAAPGRSGRR
ncbi:MAG: hypothetical protein KatS3mg118_0285 [Paracoccaceae bacterium]|nr:MAG: hypothetical protein KatS3mg118_0285 [Paracoccaceae bacterium]